MKKSLKLFILCILTLIFTGCSGWKKEISIDMLQNAAGEFRFGDVEWESSREEVETALDVTFKETVSVSEVHQAYMISDVFNLKGHAANLICEFERDKLTTVSFLIYPEEDNREAVWQEIQDELFEAYGSTEAVVQNSNSEELSLIMETETYLWEHNVNRHTALQLTKTNRNGESERIQLSVFLVTK